MNDLPDQNRIPTEPEYYAALDELAQLSVSLGANSARSRQLAASITEYEMRVAGALAAATHARCGSWFGDRQATARAQDRRGTAQAPIWRSAATSEL
jgi:hypothetical protein